MIRRATIKDVAKLAAVSTVTVSRVVNAPDLVQTETRARVQEAMRDLGYTPNIAARSMRTNLTRSIGFLTPELTSPTNAAVAQAAEQALAEAGYAMLVTSSDYSPSREIAAPGAADHEAVDCIILYVSDETDLALIEAIGRLDVPLVLLGPRAARAGRRGDVGSRGRDPRCGEPPGIARARACSARPE